MATLLTQYLLKGEIAIGVESSATSGRPQLPMLLVHALLVVFTEASGFPLWQTRCWTLWTFGLSQQSIPMCVLFTAFHSHSLESHFRCTQGPEHSEWNFWHLSLTSRVLLLHHTLLKLISTHTPFLKRNSFVVQDAKALLGVLFGTFHIFEDVKLGTSISPWIQYNVLLAFLFTAMTIVVNL